MRFVNEFYTSPLGEEWTNARLLDAYEEALDNLAVEAAHKQELREFVRFQLVGERSRRTVVPNLVRLGDFRSRATAYEQGAEQALDKLAAEIVPSAIAAEITFDAVLTSTSTGNLMPGLSYRIAARLGPLVRSNTMLVDIANVGCTGSSKALNLANSLDASFRNILVIAVECPTTLIELGSSEFSAWQGNCTFGDGAAALWISNNIEQGSQALALEEIQYQQFAETGLHLISWAYHDYYCFDLADHKTFEADVKQYVSSALKANEEAWREEPRWAIHPAGITLLMRLSRELKIPKEALEPSVAHYRKYSNMSSGSVLHVLKEIATTTPVGAAINLLTMGAGFNVIYGRVRRVR
jgi:predicted naringenin-chalcone synthase